MRRIAAVLWFLIMVVPAFAQLDNTGAADQSADITAGTPQFTVLFDLFGEIRKVTYSKVDDDAVVDRDSVLGSHEFAQTENAKMLIELLSVVDIDAVSSVNGLRDQVKTLKDALTEQRAALAPGTKTWPGNKIPYIVSASIIDAGLKSKIASAIAYWNSVSPIQLVPRTTELRSLTFNDAPGEGYDCRSQIGYSAQGGGHMSLNPVCTEGSIVHELMHSAGIMHEHQRDDRDQFVTMAPWAVSGSNLGKISVSWRTAYDLCSISHYSPNAIVPGHSGEQLFGLTALGTQNLAACRQTLSAGCKAQAPGQRCQLSTTDVMALKELYGAH